MSTAITWNTNENDSTGDQNLWGVPKAVFRGKFAGASQDLHKRE